MCDGGMGIILKEILCAKMKYLCVLTPILSSTVWFPFGLEISTAGCVISSNTKCASFSGSEQSSEKDLKLIGRQNVL